MIFYFSLLRGIFFHMYSDSKQRYLRQYSALALINSHILCHWCLMSDILSQSQRSQVMSRIRGTNTSPEMTIRRKLHSLGYRYTLHCRDLPGTPDIVFRKRKKVIQVNGCFWHRHEGCRYAYEPKSRTEFWKKKFEGTQSRDQRNATALAALGWDSLVVWECELKHMEEVTDRIIQFLSSPMGAA